MNLKFDKSSRLLKRGEFQKLQTGGKRFRGEVVRFQYLFSNETKLKLGITVSKKFGKAHDRNLFKRLSREAFRHIQDLLPHGLSITVLPHLDRAHLGFSQVLEDFRKLSLQITHDQAKS